MLSRQWSKGWHARSDLNYSEWAVVPTVTDNDLNTILRVLQPVAAIKSVVI